VTTIKLKHVDRFRDRHGKWRYYFRWGRGARIALPGQPGTPEFMAAYQSAVAGEPTGAQRKVRGEPGTFDRLVQDYFASPEFLRLAASSKATYQGVIERLIESENIGHRLVREMTRDHVRRMVSRRAGTPGAANEAIKKLRVLVHFAIDSGWLKEDATLRIKKFGAGEHHTWSDQEIAAFEQYWAIGETARLAFALLLYTGQRRGDVVRMAWTDVQDAAIRVTQQKTGAKLWIPIHSALASVLAACKLRRETIVTTSFGKPFSYNGFGNFMADRIREAGLPKRCVTHGLRKAAARRLAEAGCSANEIAAITGHATLQEVGRYTKAAEQRRLAMSAIERLSDHLSNTGFPTPDERFGKSAGKLPQNKGLYKEWQPLRV